MVGLSVESAFLNQLDPSRTYPDLPLSVEEMRQSTQLQKEELKAAGAQFESVISAADETRIKNYFDRAKTFGELEALKWLLEQQGNRP